MSISRSLSTVEPVVVSILPVMVALAPPVNAVRPFPLMSFLPAPSLISASGSIYRNIATVLSISSSDSRGRFSSGVPGIGINELIGMDLTESSARSKKRSRSF